jgi:hypothetical protein
MRPDVYTPHSTETRGRGSKWHGGGSNVVKLFKLLILAGVVVLGVAGWKALDPLGGMWLDDPVKGFEAAAKSGKPILVLYTTDRLPQDRQFNHDVLKDPEIKAFLKQEYVKVKVDMTRPYGPAHGYAARAKVRELPTLIVYSPGGREIRRVVGAEKVGAWLHRQAR